MDALRRMLVDPAARRLMSGREAVVAATDRVSEECGTESSLSALREPAA